MLPSLTERDIEAGLRSFMEREFPIATPAFRTGGQSIVDAYIEEKNQFIKGPWIEIQRPFRTSSADVAELLPHLAGKWGIGKERPPYAHQEKAFERLRYPNPKSTLVATGTGSGKTECFLLPVVDAVLQMRAAGLKDGIKAIVIYPMNALASDQARRFAKLCSRIRDQQGPQLTVGLYVGAPGSESAVMTEDACVTDRETLRKYPPDILLTNYKMLDFLLLRREDRALWEGTTAETLRYLVVDELHTFDGAQGTDLACLIRRLKDYLGITDGADQLACIGTSATLGDSGDTEALRQYAADIFASDFSDPDAVIQEDRLSFDEYMAAFGPQRFEGQWPTYSQFRNFKSLSAAAAPERFATEAYALWFKGYLSIRENDPASWTQAAIVLGRDKLPYLEAFQRLMSVPNHLIHVPTLAADWKRELSVLKGYKLEDVVLLIRSLAALISMARRVTEQGGIAPFLTVRVQAWLRELRNMLATVSMRPRLVAASDRKDDEALALPLITCRDCNATGWGSVMPDNKLSASPAAFYNAWFAQKPDCVVFYPVRSEDLVEARRLYPKELFYFNTQKRTFEFVSPDASNEDVLRKIQPDNDGSEPFILVRRPDIIETSKSEAGTVVKLSSRCPWCGGRNTMRLFGARSATISSALFGHLNSSSSNDDHKLIAFTDSVQDAAHRAGFIEARNYLYCVRQAAAGVLRAVRPGERQNLFLTLSTVTDHWLTSIGGAGALRNRGSTILTHRADDIAAARFAAVFAPADMLWRKPWLDFAQHAAELWKPAAQGGFTPAKGQSQANQNDEARFSVVPDLYENEGAERVLTPWGHFVEDVKARLRWEVFTELTLRAHAGRTIELAGIGTLVPDAALVADAAEDLRQKVVELAGGLCEKTTEDYIRLISGFLMHQKSRGAFDLSGIPGLEDFAAFAATGQDWIFNRSLTLPTYGKNFRPPAPLAMRPLKRAGKGFFDSILPASASGETWYALWLTSVLGSELDVAAACEDIYRTMLEVLAAHDLIHILWMTTDENTPVYLLNPQTWFVERRLCRAVCPRCGRWHVIGADECSTSLWSGMPCLSGKCAGSAHRIEPFREEEALYQGVPVRATAREHTSNVPSAERGEIERSFIHGTEPWDVNLLSATPTLEMGIDIGDLSSVLLGSMPPTQANYLQRIGRAGRRDGNALALTICGTDPHSMYFWSDPEKMLAGEVEPPGVFLHAMAVLERQLFALALQRWMTAYASAVLPKTIQSLLAPEVISAEHYEPSSFPLGFLDFAANESDAVLKAFCALFAVKTDEDGGVPKPRFTAQEAARLRAFLTGAADASAAAGASRTSLRDRLIGKFRQLSLMREGYLEKRKNYQNALKRRQNDPADEARDNDIEELKQTISSISKLISEEFAKKETLNMLADEGLLPNYAFPEEGITIDSMVIRLRSRPQAAALSSSAPAAVRKHPSERGAGVYKRFTFQRAASSGLSEAAPENNFYINEYVLHIDQVKLGDDDLTHWRFCPNCQYCEQVFPDEESSACPRCGSPAWRDASQVREVLPLKTVYAWADLKDDRIKDDRESRFTLKQQRRLLVDFPKNAERRSFVMDESAGGFGFEYVSSASLRDFNFGPANKSDAAEPFEVAGDSVRAPGFTVCRGCGRVKQSEHALRSRPQHDFDCPYAKHPEKAEWVEGMILYRSFQSEALRIRIPSGVFISNYSPDVVEASLAAALRTGLKHYFHGSVDHLRFLKTSDPIDGGAERRCIVIYDSVPGGTGYLKELLAAPEVLLGVLREALSVMTACTCEDGCYQCVYAHLDAEERPCISKRCAVDITAGILAATPTLKEGSIDAGSSDGDSELEARFIRALAAAEPIEQMTRCQEGEPHYLIRMKTGRLWRMSMQVDKLGSVPSRPDFVLEPYKESERSKPLTMNVFTDGWRYHADIVAEDCAKRQSILNAGERVWTLSWHDIPDGRPVSHVVRPPLHDDQILLRPAPRPDSWIAKQYDAWRLQMKRAAGRDYPALAQLLEDWTEHKNSFDRLLAWLSDPDAARLAAQALAFFKAMQSVMSDERQPLNLQACVGVVGEMLAQTTDPGRQSFGFGESSDRLWATLFDFRNTYRTAFFVNSKNAELHGGEPSSSPCSQSLRNFWASVNMAALSEGVVLFPEPRRADGQTPKTADESPWTEALASLAQTPGTIIPQSVRSMSPQAPSLEPIPAKSRQSSLWMQAKTLLPEQLHPLADALEQANVPIDLNNIGCEYADAAGRVCAEFELYWPEKKTAVAFKPEGPFPSGFTVLDAALPAGELARRVAQALA